MKTWKLVIATMSMVILMAFPSFAGWIQAEDGRWWYLNEDGTYPADGWLWIDGNEDGVAECYCFDGDGWMIAREFDSATPDGWTVNSDGTRKIPIYNLKQMTDDEWNALAAKNKNRIAR